MKEKVALVLSGGGARGIAHIGVIEELENRGYDISSIAGTSMGALVGGIYSLGKMEEFKDWLFTLDKFKVFNLVDFTLSLQGFVKGDKVLKKIREFVPDGDIEDLRLPYVAVAADIINKKEVVFRSGSVFDAIRASISIPTVFTPVRTEYGLLVDGGVVNNIPVKHVARMADDRLIVVNVNANIPVRKPELTEVEELSQENVYQKKIREFYNHLHEYIPFHKDEQAEAGIVKKKDHEKRLDYFNLINKTLSSMTYTLAEMTLQQFDPDFLIKVSGRSCGTFDFYKAEEMVEIGRLAAHETLEGI